jgi:hypothetical protein
MSMGFFVLGRIVQGCFVLGRIVQGCIVRVSKYRILLLVSRSQSSFMRRLDEVPGTGTSYKFILAQKM